MDASTLRADPARASRGPADGGDLVVVEGLGRTYGNGTGAVRALADVNLRIRRGEFVTILGPSGCGKSTLLNILAGFDAPSEGRALVEGVPVNGPSPTRGVVFQDSGALFPWFTVRGNIQFGPRAAGRAEAEIEARTREVLALVGLSDFAGKYPKQLSGGMRQLVSIARVLVMDVRLLLLDEPFAALDAITRRHMQEQLIRICGLAGTTNLFITHSVDEAIYLGDRVLVMSGRPGSVKGEIDVGLPRPRNLASVEFNALRGRALAMLGE
jgi:ABC-type nitrate/sulfonate/bicarbonate transport system ATPase subunit